MIGAVLQECDFQTVLPVWRDMLWPGRTDIQPMSSMQWKAENDPNIYFRFKPRFCCIYVNDQLAGVNSCHMTSDQLMRSRGIYVFPRWRGRGFSTMLLGFVDDNALALGCSRVWSFPRIESMFAYAKHGYRIASREFDSGPFGPNVYAIKNL